MSNTITHCLHESYNGSNAKLGYAELLFSLTVFGLRFCSQAENSSAHKDIINLGPWDMGRRLCTSQRMVPQRLQILETKSSLRPRKFATKLLDL